MSALTVYTALEAKFQAIPGLKAVMLGEPTAIQTAPALYTALESWGSILPGEPQFRSVQNGTRYTFTHRLIVKWQDNDAAERELLSLVDAIPAAINSDPHLSGALSAGGAKILTGEAGFVTIAKTLYRIVDYTSTVLEKGAAA